MKIFEVAKVVVLGAVFGLALFGCSEEQPSQQLSSNDGIFAFNDFESGSFALDTADTGVAFVPSDSGIWLETGIFLPPFETDQDTDNDTDEETDGETDEETDGETDEETDGETDEETDGETDEETDGETEEEADGETEEEADGETGETDPDPGTLASERTKEPGGVNCAHSSGAVPGVWSLGILALWVRRRRREDQSS